MANEIVGLEKNDDRINVAIYVPISTPASVSGSNPVVTPSSGVPQIAADTWGQAKLDNLDSGDAMFSTVSITIPEGMSTSELAARVVEVYTNKASELLEEYNNKYEFAGATVDATL